MPRIVPPLTERALLALAADTLKTDGKVQGLYAHKVDGKIRFYLRLTQDGKRTKRLLGVLGEDLTLEGARAKALAVLGAVVSTGSPEATLNPAKALKKEAIAKAKLNDSRRFVTVIEEYFEDRKDVKSLRTYALNKTRIYANVSPYFNNVPVSEITGPMCFDCLKVVYNRGATDLASRIYYVMRDFFRYCMFKGYAISNPLDSFMAKDLGKVDKGNFAAITEPKEFGTYIKTIRESVTSPTLRNALLISAHVFIRSSELRLGKWEEVDFENKTWIIPKSRMKVKTKDHIIPLTNEVIELLKNQKDLVGDNPLMFPGTPKTQSLSDGAFAMALHRLGLNVTHHGFRASFRTIGREVLRLSERIMELQLAHVPKNTVEAAYDRTLLIEERREMLEKWSKYIVEISK